MRKKIFAFIILSMLTLSSTGIYLISQINATDSHNQFFDQVKAKPFNILIMVKDRESNSTDSIICVNYKPNLGKFTMLNIPRDTLTYFNGRQVKINSIYSRSTYDGLNGGNEVKNRVASILNINIKYYAVFDMNTIVKIVDTLGGVKFDVPFHMVYNDKSQNLHINIPKGYQTLNGENVVKLLRFRHANVNAPHPEGYNKYYGSNSDLDRINMQHRFLKEFTKQFLTPNTIARASELLKIAIKDTQTNLKLPDCVKYSTKANLAFGKKISSFRLHGTDVVPGWYYKYDNQIMDTGSQKLYDGELILNKYFNLSEVVASPTTQSTNLQ